MTPLQVLLLAIVSTIQKVQSIGGDYCYPAAKCIRDEIGNATSVDLYNGVSSFAFHNATSYSTRTVSDFGWCAAAHSCSLNTIKQAFDPSCVAQASCAALTIIPPLPTTALNFGYDMECDGDQACSHSYISGTNEISAYSAYSLFNSIVDSVNCVLTNYGGSASAHLTVDLRGYHAGLGAKIICRANHSCIIHCYANACFNLSLQCDGLCQVNVQSVDTIEPIYVPQIDITPRDPFNHGFELLYDSYMLSLENDEECRKLHRNFTFDVFDEALSIRALHLTGGIHWDEDIPVCCRSWYSCEDVYNIISSEFVDQRTICSGSEACIYDELIQNYNGPIFCSGASSCAAGSLDTIIDTFKSLYCGASGACYKSALYNAERFICSGTQSCRRTDIFTSGLSKTHYIYFLGYWSGWEATVHCLATDICYILCWAASACEETQLICDGTCIVECDKDTLCPYDSVSLEYLYPTSAPTMIPTVDPTIEPTIDPVPDPTTQPTIDPTIDPTTEPTVDPTIDPTVDPVPDPTIDPTVIPSTDPTVNPTVVPTIDPTVHPTVDPSTLPTNDPTVYPTLDPTEKPSESPLFSDSISMQFTAYIKLEQYEMNDKDLIEIERQIVVALHDSNIDVLRTDVFENGVVVLDFIISSRRYTELEANIVANIVEEELKDDVGDVQVSVVPYEAEIVTNNKRKGILYGLYNDIAIFLMFAIIIATVACVVYCYLENRKSNQQIVELTLAQTNVSWDENKANDPMADVPNMASEEVHVAQVIHHRRDSSGMYNNEGNNNGPMTKTAQDEKESEGAEDNNTVAPMHMIANNEIAAAPMQLLAIDTNDDDSAAPAVSTASDKGSNTSKGGAVISPANDPAAISGTTDGLLISPENDGDV